MNSDKNKVKVLVLFAAVKVYGMERANISVFSLLKDYGVESLFVIGSESLKEVAPELERHGLKYITARFGGLIFKSQTINTKIKSIINFSLNAYDLRKIIRKFKPDYIHIPNELSFIMSFITLITQKIPLVYRMGDEPLNYKLHFRLFRKHIINRRVNRYVVNSEFIKKSLLTTGCDENKINLIYSYPPVRKNRNTAFELPQITKDNFVVFYVGQLAENKGVHLLLEAADILLKKHDDIVFIFTGDGDRHSKFYIDIMKRRDIIVEKERLIFTGFLEAVDSIFSISSLHICPSIYEEPLANVVIEAKKNSVPSVIFRSGGLPELVEHLQDGYICEEKTVEDLIKAIEYFYFRRTELNNYSKEANKSLTKLGITKESFTENWLRIFK